MFIAEYDRTRAVNYARKWALSYNPAFYSFDEIGGDCTNFVSQCVYAGSGIMNFTPTYGWYYISPQMRSPSWTGVQYFFDFLTGNTGLSAFADVVEYYEANVGDVVQLGDGELFYHSLLISEIDDYPFENPLENIKVCAHSFPALDKPLSLYNFAEARFLHIQGVRFP